MTDSLTKVRDRMKQLRDSQRKGVKNERVIYRIEPTDSNEKFKQKAHTEAWRSGGYQGPNSGRVK